MWSERTKDGQWADLSVSAEQAVEGAILDAVWASRDLVRRKGFRQTTFAARCADPEYGKFAFVRLGLILNEMEQIANHVSEEVYTHPLEQSAIQNVLQDMRLAHEAQEELDRDVPRLTP